MPKIQLISDVHGRWEDVKIDPEAKLIVAAGDLTEGCEGVDWLKEFDRPVIYVPGNHEFYDDDISSRLAQLKAKAHGSKISVMDRSTALAGEWRFICCTLWTDHNGLDSRLMAESMRIMNDYKNIRIDKWIKNPDNAWRYENLRHQFEDDNPEFKGTIPQKADKMNPISALCLHLQDVDFLAAELAKPWKGRTAIVTHHAPSTHSLAMGGYSPSGDAGLYSGLIPWKHRPHKIGAYASSLEYLFSNHKIDLWFHGHLHEGLRYCLYGADVVTNPTGYYDGQNAIYEKSLCFELNDPLRHSRVLALTARKSLETQRSFMLALMNAVTGDSLSCAKHFGDYERIVGFCRLYNQAISCLLQQGKKDVSQAAFRAEILNPAKVMPALIPGARLTPAKRLRHLHDMLTFVQSNEKRTAAWLDSIAHAEDLASLGERGIPLEALHRT